MNILHKNILNCLNSIKNADELSKIYNYLVSIWPDPNEIINKEFSSINKDSFFTNFLPSEII